MELLTIEYEVINTGSARNYLNIWLGEEELIYWYYNTGQFTNVIKKWIALSEPTEFGISDYVDRAYFGDTLELRFTKIQIGDQDLLADGLVQWEVSGPGVHEIVEEGGTTYLRIFMSSSVIRSGEITLRRIAFRRIDCSIPSTNEN